MKMDFMKRTLDRVMIDALNGMLIDSKKELDKNFKQQMELEFKRLDTVDDEIELMNIDAQIELNLFAMKLQTSMIEEIEKKCKAIERRIEMSAAIEYGY